MPETFCTCVSLRQARDLTTTPRHTEVVQRTIINCKHGCCRTEFRGHVRQGSTVCQRQLGYTRAEEVQEGTNHTCFTKLLSQSARDVGSEIALRQCVLALMRF